MLEINNISKTFAKGTVNEHTAINHMSLNLKDGDFVTVVGSNGAGKSTLFNAICGTFMVDKGNILLDGEDITFKSEHARAKLIGRVFQDPMKGTAPNMTIEENLALAYTRAGKKNSPFKRAITKKQTAFFRENLARYNMGIEDRMKTKIGLLSGGQRQVVTLLMCTLSIPKLLLLDEHTAALDPKTAEIIMELTDKIVREKKVTTIMVTHNLRYAVEYGDRILMMHQGNAVLDKAGEEKKAINTEEIMGIFNRISVECGN